MLTDIAIINYNSTKYIIDCIESIRKDNPGSKIIVVDNKSNDQPEKIIEAFPNTVLIKNAFNVGFAKAANQALKKCSKDHVLLLNPDTLVMEGFFDHLSHFIPYNADAAIIGPAVYEEDGQLQGSARKFPDAMTFFLGRKSPIIKWFPNSSIAKNEFPCFYHNNVPIEVDWVSGACMLINRKAFESVGGFDESIFMYWEDADLCKRLRENGWRVIYFPQAKIKHLVGISSDSRPIESIIHFHYSCYKYFKKHASKIWRVFSPIVIAGLVIRGGFAIVRRSVQKKRK